MNKIQTINLEASMPLWLWIVLVVVLVLLVAGWFQRRRSTL